MTTIFEKKCLHIEDNNRQRHGYHVKMIKINLTYCFWNHISRLTHDVFEWLSQVDVPYLSFSKHLRFQGPNLRQLTSAWKQVILVYNTVVMLLNPTLECASKVNCIHLFLFQRFWVVFSPFQIKICLSIGLSLGLRSIKLVSATLVC